MLLLRPNQEIIIKNKRNYKQKKKMKP